MLLELPFLSPNPSVHTTHLAERNKQLNVVKRRAEPDLTTGSIQRLANRPNNLLVVVRVIRQPRRLADRDNLFFVETAKERTV